eukprot:10378325-Ditylum_brightwellii.AAC.1
MTGMRPCFSLRYGAVVKAVELALNAARLFLIRYKRDGLCVPSVVVFTTMDMEVKLRHEETL